jgi:Mlc titration factor MtfA (ptsG expression regulator)
MLFSFLKRRRRAKLLAETFPQKWEVVLRDGFPQFAMLPEDLQPRLRKRIQLFIAEKYWEGINGFEITDEMRVVVAAMACTLTLAFDEDSALYPNVSRI